MHLLDPINISADDTVVPHGSPSLYEHFPDYTEVILSM
jgi:hypothetical protein